MCHTATLCHHRAEAPPQLRKKPAVSLYLLLRPSPSGKHGDMRHATCGPVSRITISGPAASRRHVAVSPCRRVNIADWWPTAHRENLGHKEGIFYCLMCLLSMMQHTIIHLCMMALFSSDFNHILSDRLHAFQQCSAVAHIWARQPQPAEYRSESWSLEQAGVWWDGGIME